MSSCWPLIFHAEDGLATSVVDAYVYKATSDNLNGKVVVILHLHEPQSSFPFWLSRKYIGSISVIYLFSSLVSFGRFGINRCIILLSYNFFIILHFVN